MTILSETRKNDIMKNNHHSAIQTFAYIDILTILSAFAVVMLHANGVFWRHPVGRLWLTSNFIETMFFFAVPIFFMISGATLMDYKDKYTTKEFFVRRAIRVGIPFFAWKIGCCIFAFVRGDLPCDHILSKKMAVILIREIYNSNIIGIYWFFLPLFVIYLSIPFLASVQEKQKNFAYVIVWTVLVLAVQQLADFLNWKFGWPENPDLYKISSVVSAYPLLYPLLGYYLATYDIPRKYRIVIYLLGIAGFLMHFCNAPHLSRAALRKSGKKVCFRGLRESVMPG